MSIESTKAMTVVFRVDASVQMGTGHVMRCLTLASALHEQGYRCYFICRNHIGNLIDKIQQSGFLVYIIESCSYDNADYSLLTSEQKPLFHANWLGTTQKQDAKECLTILEKLQPDWLVVDHYALDQNWQQALKSHYKKLMVIDDLGDRGHVADLLLDQNYGATVKKYDGLIPKSCKVLLGTNFALLRAEFALWRDYSLARRKGATSINSILVTLGGADPDNYTGKILQQLASIEISPQVKIVVVMGATAPHLQLVQRQAANMSVKTTVKVNVINMAELMSNADLAIGAAGATTWERCCLGLPTIQLVIAENQRQIAEALATDTAIKLLKDTSELTFLMSTVDQWILPIATRAQSIVDGLGSKRVVSHIIRIT